MKKKFGAMVLSAGAVVALALANHTASAAERLGRLTVDIKVTGQEQWRNANRRHCPDGVVFHRG